MLKRLFNSSSASFVDPLDNGTLTIQPLANGDSVVYPPVIGSESEATDTHYLESGYLASSISDTNNPVVTMRTELIEHFSSTTGGNNIAVFHNNAQTPKLSALAEFQAVPDNFIRTGDNINVPQNLPSVPGTIMGRGYGVWFVEWDWIPANYMLAIHLDEPAPLRRRVDTLVSGIPRGLHAYYNDAVRPIETMSWRARFGFGCGNRLNGVVMELGTGGSYTVPTIYQ
jgi:hypothetical protein